MNEKSSKRPHQVRTTARDKKQRQSQPTVTTNIGAFDIVPRGTKITLDFSEPVHSRAIESGTLFSGTRSKPVMSNKGRRLTVTLDDSFQLGRNTLRLHNLFTVNNERIEANSDVPFFIVHSKLAFPRGVRIRAYSRVVVADYGIRQARLGEALTYELMKGIDTNGKRWEAAYDKRGEKVDFNQVLGSLAEAHVKRYGKIHPVLHDLIQGGDSKPISVAIWLAGERPIIRKITRRPIDKIPAAEAAELKRLQSLAARFIEKFELRTFDPNVRTDRAAPVVFAELDPKAVRRLAELPDVEMIFFYDRNGVDDLTNSIAIAQTSNAHSLGYTGKKVKVAVYERGPDDTTNLRIAGRFRTDPDTSEHSRLTHGIIKNRERRAPYGHAPDCLLFSANDYALDAIAWAADEGCSVISQSFHRTKEETSGILSFDDHYKDWLVLHWPYPTICEAAGNGKDEEFVNHKGYNRLTVGSHDDQAEAMADDSVFRNPNSDHGSRELPEIAANGVEVTAVGLTNWGTSFATPAVASAAACIQEADVLVRFFPVACRAILLASARLNPAGDTWWNDQSGNRDALDGTGALNTYGAVRVAEQRRSRNNRPSPKGWDVSTLFASDINSIGESTFSYNIQVPRHPMIFTTKVKVALAWNSEITRRRIHHNISIFSSVLTVDLDLRVYDRLGNEVARSCSWDNSYEVAEFVARHGETYTVRIQRWAGDAEVEYGIAWDTQTTSPVHDLGDVVGVLTTRSR